MQVIDAKLAERVEQSEMRYMVDRMRAMQERPGNPMGVEIARFGNAVALYAREMPWPQFNTVKGLSEAEAERVDEVIAWYGDRAPQWEIIPSRGGQALQQRLAQRGYYQSGFHSSWFMPLVLESRQSDPAAETGRETSSGEWRLAELSLADGLEQYARVHCLATGLPLSGAEAVAANNEVLLGRAGWSFYLAEAEDGEPAGAAVMHCADGVASLTFAAVLPQYRGRGLHQALILRRLEQARASGCTLAVSQAAYASASARNMERCGLRLAYTRATWSALP